ncbi:DUF4129 domain-containing protein [Glycomyces sp. NRRL B-16210]|uniref:DUF4129 domain-containing protein n=1 Tax=Glycomyces sp. NRRL B-16210 TaxID=1463821 RepID=UPI00069003A5|nr:DUF4129 domain-containing protein [Glycomyces sp. NRRL B-16210]
MTHPAPHPPRRWLPVVIVAAALLVVGIAAQGTGVGWQEANLPEVPVEQEPPPMEFESVEEMPSVEIREPVDGGFTLPPWVSWVVLGLLVGVPALLILTFLVRRLIEWLVDAPGSTGEPEPETAHLHRDFALVEDAVAAAIAEMDLGTDPRSAIIACWVHLERASETVGIERDASDTPTDLVRKLLERHRLDGDPLRRLCDAYLRARYSPHDVGDTDRDQARDALVALQSQLGLRVGR